MEGHSPEQIASILMTHPPEEISDTVCTETIYQYIYVGEGRMGGFFKKLRRKQKVRQKRSDQKPQASRIQGSISIHERPETIGKRERYGYWETDPIIFPGQESVLSVQLERKMRLFRLSKVKNKTAKEHEHSIQRHLSLLPHLRFVRA